MLLGFDVELSKRQWAALSNTVLGVHVDLSQAHRPGGAATAATTQSRVNKTLDMMRECARAGRLSAAVALKLRGLLGFALLPVAFRFGRAAMQPLADVGANEGRHAASSRRLGRCSRHGWSRQLRAMHSFFERTLPSLPPLAVMMTRSRERPVLVYTDASFHLRGGKRVAILGLYVKDPVTGQEWWSRLTLPAYYYRYFAPDKKTYIMQAELTAAVAVFFTLPALLRGRRALLFIDNVAALSAIVKGYARCADAAVLVNSFHGAVSNF